ncbi:MAG: endonuclease domain-containing protein [Actinobacteria bacterium]|nr:endonuclease domain-containing protein [Thermoleophilia bacterium]MCB9011956.1 endonuclease domain-containing protein [Actinomycetota bacterium]
MTAGRHPGEVVPFSPHAHDTFRFLDRSMDDRGVVRLRYGLDGGPEFEERFDLPLPDSREAVDEARIERLLSLLHWVAGVSYYKTAAPPRVAFSGGPPPPATATLLEVLYSEGLGEFAATAGLRHIPRPAFAPGPAPDLHPDDTPPRRVLVPVGGGKDSAVAIEVVRRSGLEFALFSVGAAPAIERTVAVADRPWLRARRHIDPLVRDGLLHSALNGHVPVTAIVSCVALLVAALHGYDTVSLANERSASAGNRWFDGVEINHQFSKSARAEALFADALREVAPGLRLFSILRPASELSIARAFARLTRYHRAFTSCNRVFRIDEARRSESWCGDCDKCRFVFLILAPFLDPGAMRDIFGSDMLNDDTQRDGFARLTGTGGHKPFECVGEVEESVAAARMLASDPRWRDHRVVAHLAEHVLPRFGADVADPAEIMELSSEHAVPADLLPALHEILGT